MGNANVKSKSRNDGGTVSTALPVDGCGGAPLVAPPLRGGETVVTETTEDTRE